MSQTQAKSLFAINSLTRTPQASPKPKAESEPQFNYDLERMKQAVESESITMPDFKDFKEFDKWLMSL